MGTALCVVCAGRHPESFTDPGALLCCECETRWAVCLDRDQPFLIAETTTAVRCDPCLVVHLRPARIAA